MKEDLNLSLTRKTSKQVENKKNIKTLNNSKIINLFFIEVLGYFFILLSGLVPFLHSFIKHETLEEKLFGFTSVQSFLYSFGVHFSIFLIVVGVLLAISVPVDENRYKTVQKFLRYCLISPFVSAIFYCTWVFIPNVNYNLLAYIFFALFICVISIIIFAIIFVRISELKLIYEQQIDILKKSLYNIKISVSETKISQEITEEILRSIVNFEKSNNFLDRDINLNSLAILLKTNSKYLSKTINQHKQKTFTQYINDLRIEYLIEKLKTDTSYTKYSIKAIAEEIGFKTPNAFSRAFFKKIGKYPSEYIKEL